MDCIPVNLLTGFLGNGKSTLLTQILTETEFGDTAVVVNEFGEIGHFGPLFCCPDTNNHEVPHDREIPPGRHRVHLSIEVRQPVQPLAGV